MSLFAMAIPVLPGKTEQWRQFVGELQGARYSEFAASRQQLDVRERTFLQHTPQGDLVIVTLEGPDPVGSFQRFGAATDAFAQWFKQQVQEIHGLDLAAPPPGPMPEQVIDSQSR